MQCLGGIRMLTLLSKQMPKANIIFNAFPRPIMGKTAARQLRPYSMLSKQDSLPLLPVPTLQQTMDKYLMCIKPLVDKEDFEYTKRVVEEFQRPNGVGESLQAKLMNKAQSKKNWLAMWWDNVAYLDARCPVVVNVSPGIAFPKVNFKDKVDHLKYAARLTNSVLNFRHLVDSESIPPDMMGKSPLCMAQYLKLLCSNRIPHPVRDEQYIAPRGESKHIVVAHKNQFYVVNVYNGQSILSEAELVAQLKKIVENTEPLEEPVGILTSDDRNSWANTRRKMMKEATNRANFKAIQNAIFLLCLDQRPPHSAQAPSRMEDPTASVTARQCMHGDGTQSNSCNRWFDKIIQFVVSEDGHAGLCYEHSSAEGPPVAALCDFIMKDIDGYGSIELKSLAQAAPAKLKWHITDKVQDAIRTSMVNLDSLVSDIDLRCFTFNGYGKDFVKKQRMSPDAWFQMGMHLTFYRIHNHSPPTYETGSTRKFILGRTDTIRTASVASSEFCKAMVSPNKTNAQRLELLKKAVDAHVKYTKETVNGQAIDRHLLGLKLTALESGMNLPELFMDTSFQYAHHFKMSTSQVPSKYPIFLSFGPAVPDGYGVCYNPMKDRVIFGVSSVNSNPETNSGHFAANLQKSLEEMQLLSTSSKL